MVFGTKIKAGKKDAFTPLDLPTFIRGVQICVFSLTDDLAKEGRKDLADEIIAQDKKQHEVPIPEAFLK